MNQRLHELMNWLKQENIDSAFITSTENVFYLSGFRSDPHERLLGIAVFQEAEPFLICPSLDVNDAKATGWEYEVIGCSDTDNPWDTLEKNMKSRVTNIHTMALEKEHVIVERYEQLINRFEGTKFIAAEEKLRQLRLIKNEKEKELLKKAAEFADFAVQTGVSEIKEGKTELDIIAAIEYELKKKGISEMSFSTMVLTGANAASPHGNPGLTKIKKGDFVLFDLGVVYEGYCSDITRTVAYDHFNEEQEKIYNTVLKAEIEAINATKPGVQAKDLDNIARNIITEAGYGQYFPHRLGHGLGIGVHEYPSVTNTNELIIQEGMVFTIEPGIYVPNVAGVRIEDDVFVTKDGVEILTAFPKELQIIK
ncbi:Xaa-Pro peptidase family protein [Heyndrickxia oleronia]|uniref:Peptidase M24 family protein n=1 Tax=Heyndrickxia oleronia TaxID=38875 RepID=A0A8E2LF07_9BACI|nr:Xaa-Pro peptidase family protein [Heyndrickxia oleronia]MEC1374031.1 Xaa-Pro peptidase family protein [Heyndrickxia oleronia]OOP68332.1 peptidase M24 family protein [Heyndrickxia oleronia]QQZ06368.1 aminopeptidase P family protein [Heyndrickxia oleronia]